MKFNLKYYKFLKTKKYIKTNNFFFIFNGTNLDSEKWIATEQNLKNLKLNYYKIYNKTAIKTIKNSIYKNIKQIISGVTFFIKSEYQSNLIHKNNLLKDLKSLLFILLAIKINNKIYSIPQIKTLTSLKYTDNIKIFHQFLTANLKLCSKLNKK